MFEKASRLRLRFPTTQGDLTVEDLWRLPLTSSSGRPNLDQIAIELHKVVSPSAARSFVDPTLATASESDTLAFEIVTHIIKVKLEERKAELDALQKKQMLQKLQGLIAQKEEEHLSNRSVEELKAMADALQN